MADDGGGSNFNQPPHTIEYDLFYNTVVYDGGGMYNILLPPIIMNNDLFHNTAVYYGGGTTSSLPTITQYVSLYDNVKNGSNKKNSSVDIKEFSPS
jgi:hypothetical protein